MNVRFLRPGQEEYLEAVRYYAGRAPNLAAAFLDDLDHAVEVIAAHPQIGSPYADDARRFLLKRFPYSLIYIIESGQILIVAVRHHRQDPVSWRERI